ncbi:MAG: tetratricopeptide repeat protein [Lactobacillus sp.]|nr:tetratricopeptide repeat protein [Lactobacillus sp.]MDN6052420.1 tetratricopeptide repeat protein [Lactobacillus sp.]
MKKANLPDQAKVDAMIHRLVTAIDADPHAVENYLQLSSYLLEQGSADQAAKLLEEAQHLVAQPTLLSYNLAVCYYMQGKFDQALQLLDQIPNDDLTLYQKALVYLKLGQNQKALAYAMTIKQPDSRVKELLGDIWLALGELATTRKELLTIQPKARSSKVYFLLAVATLTQDRDQSHVYFERSKALDPKYYERAGSQYQAIMKLLRKKEKQDD